MRARRPLDVRPAAPGPQFKQAAQQCADRVLTGACSEVQDKPAVAVKVGLDRLALKLLYEASLADPCIAADKDGLSATRFQTRAERAHELVELCPAAHNARRLGSAASRSPSNCHATMGSAKPLTVSAPKVEHSIRSASRRRTASEIRVVPVSAASVRRDAKFTESPVIAYSCWPPLRMPLATTCPLAMPM